MSEHAKTLEMMAELVGRPADPFRALARDEAGAWYLIELDASGARRMLSDPVTPELAEQAAIAILGGDARALTKHANLMTMAVFIVGLLFMARKGLAYDQALPDPSPSGGATPPASAAAPPGAPPLAPGGDLFGHANHRS